MTTIRYYRRKTDRTLWVILCEDGQPLKARGPLSEDALLRAGPAWRLHEGEDARAFQLTDFEIAGTGSWSSWEGNPRYPVQGLAAMADELAAAGRVRTLTIPAQTLQALARQ